MSQKFTDWDATASNNTTVGTGAIDIDEGCLSGNVNNALREVMAAAVRSSGLPGLDGTARPSGVQAGQWWLDTTTATAPIIKYYDGTDDIDYATIDYVANTITLASGVGGTGIADLVDDTTPQLGGQLDVNGNAIGDGTLELLTFTEDASAVNHVNIENEATGSGPIIRSAGDDTNIDLNIEAKGSGVINLNDTVTVIDDIQHAGDTNNKIAFATDTQDFQTGGSSRLDISDSGVRLGGANSRVTTILDEDAMGSDSATALATQQSIKAYVDANSSRQLFHLQHQETAGTDGGTLTASTWTKRAQSGGNLTSITNEISGASVASAVITLPAGTYWAEINAMQGGPDASVIRLRNTTDSTNLLVSMASTNGTSANNSVVPVRGRFTLAASKNIEIQHNVGTTRSGTGMGTASNLGVTEIYMDAMFWKVS